MAGGGRRTIAWAQGVKEATVNPRQRLNTTVRLLLSPLLMAAASVVTFAVAVPAEAATLSEVTGFATNPGNLRMFRYVPAALPSNAPVVVALHGCTQSAAAYDDEPGWTALAERWGFVLVLPQQQSANNVNGCFNWFSADDISRGLGEAMSIKQMVDRTKADHSVDARRVYVTGLSAGGAMTAAMLASYPDVFAAGAVVAGLPYMCATMLSAAYGCMSPGVDRTPAHWGGLVRGASSYSGPWPKVSIWHGSWDTTVVPKNATELMEQWTNVNGADQTADSSDTVKGYQHRSYQDGSGRTVVETYLISGMAHGTPIDPGTADDACGTAAPYILDVNNLFELLHRPLLGP